VTSGKHGVMLKHIEFYCLSWFLSVNQHFIILFVKETPEPFPLPNEVSIVKAASAWAHCVAATGKLCFFILPA